MQDGQQQQHGKQRTRRKFSEEFKRDAVEMVRNSGRPIADVAAELPLAADRSQIALFVRELTSRPSRRGANVVALDSGSGLATATC